MHSPTTKGSSSHWLLLTPSTVLVSTSCEFLLLSTFSIISSCTFLLPRVHLVARQDAGYEFCEIVRLGQQPGFGWRGTWQVLTRHLAETADTSKQIRMERDRVWAHEKRRNGNCEAAFSYLFKMRMLSLYTMLTRNSAKYMEGPRGLWCVKHCQTGYKVVVVVKWQVWP